MNNQDKFWNARQLIGLPIKINGGTVTIVPVEQTNRGTTKCVNQGFKVTDDRYYSIENSRLIGFANQQYANVELENLPKDDEAIQTWNRKGIELQQKKAEKLSKGITDAFEKFGKLQLGTVLVGTNGKLYSFDGFTPRSVKFPLKGTEVMMQNGEYVKVFAQMKFTADFIKEIKYGTTAKEGY